MFKALKWAYNRGVHQERVRIARALENKLFSLRHDLDDRRLEFNTIENTNRRKLNLANELRLKEALQEIITGILLPDPFRYQETTSIMFPKDNKEK